MDRKAQNSEPKRGHKRSSGDSAGSPLPWPGPSRYAKVTRRPKSKERSLSHVRSPQRDNRVNSPRSPNTRERSFKFFKNVKSKHSRYDCQSSTATRKSDICDANVMLQNTRNHKRLVTNLEDQIAKLNSENARKDDRIKSLLTYRQDCIIFENQIKKYKIELRRRDIELEETKNNYINAEALVRNMSAHITDMEAVRHDDTENLIRNLRLENSKLKIEMELMLKVKSENNFEAIQSLENQLSQRCNEINILKADLEEKSLKCDEYNQYVKESTEFEDDLQNTNDVLMQKIQAEQLEKSQLQEILAFTSVKLKEFEINNNNLKAENHELKAKINQNESKLSTDTTSTFSHGVKVKLEPEEDSKSSVYHYIKVQEDNIRIVGENAKLKLQLESEEAKNEASLKDIEVLKAKLAQMKEDMVNNKEASPEAGSSEEYSSDTKEIVETAEEIETVHCTDSNNMIIDDGEILIACEETI